MVSQDKQEVEPDSFLNSCSHSCSLFSLITCIGHILYFLEQIFQFSLLVSVDSLDADKRELVKSFRLRLHLHMYYLSAAVMQYRD